MCRRADSWPKDPVWTGRLVISSINDATQIQLRDPKTGTIRHSRITFEHLSSVLGALFAACPISKDGPPAVTKGRHAFIGIAFEDRNDAFDFNVAIDDHQNEVKREEHAATEAVTNPTVSKDFSLKQGQTIKIKLNKKEKDSDSNPAPVQPLAAPSASKQSDNFGQSSIMQQVARRAFSSKTIPEITRVGMVGMGLMGHGIAQTAATAGYDVIAVDTNQKGLDAGLKRIEGSLEKIHARQIKKGDLTEDQAKDLFVSIMGRIHGTIDKKDLAPCDLVIEAIIEDTDIKKSFYKELGQIVKPSGVLASNTSSLPIGDFAGSSGRADKVVGLHFFNPVQLMKLVEVVKTDLTDPNVFDVAKRWAVSVGKTPVSCKDTPGLLVPNLVQALQLLERGDASMEDIDISMQLGAGHPMGPITLADYIGLDTILFILEGWVQKYPTEPSFVVPTILKQMVQDGKLGRKAGQGFYKWNGDKRV
ncbi:hypothetical protein DYB37_005428 [Aphanomyces astaci]|uniref:3-hydroxyacyl-CoA dehydrogenase n=1 Tax=Aphanomyces astaci TaxID=112090 RepID=A0A3R6YCJ2_APHAT|nr:hypothetical protein DYB37_005428 [Aphanomyces astaci]